ncbi:hypothetical protein N1851_002801 [Merluccius polli]|uniref:Uncharacterized protein n=1 Tax=Merluccius polli TaxID=89951 RepID=A0AA47N9G3_MERPO|nr:hypothetical protein N1851_002801 [Merluccius polli]
MGSGLRREAPCTSWVSCWVTLVTIPARRLDTLNLSIHNREHRHTKIHKILWREDVITVITACAILHNRILKVICCVHSYGEVSCLVEEVICYVISKILTKFFKCRLEGVEYDPGVSLLLCGFQSRNRDNRPFCQHHTLCLFFETTTQVEMSWAKIGRISFPAHLF